MPNVSLSVYRHNETTCILFIFLVPTFSRIPTEYGEILRTESISSVFCTEYLSVFSPNAGKCGKNLDQNNTEYGHFLRSGCFV